MTRKLIDPIKYAQALLRGESVPDIHKSKKARIARQIVDELVWIRRTDLLTMQRTYGLIYLILGGVVENSVGVWRLALLYLDGVPATMAERKFVIDTLRRGKLRHVKAKAADGYNPNVLPPTSKLRKASEERHIFRFEEMARQPLSERQITLNKARVAAGEVSEEFLRRQFQWYDKPPEKRANDVRRMLRGKKTQAMVAAEARAVNQKKKKTTKLSEKRAKRIREYERKGLTKPTQIAKRMKLSVRQIQRLRGGK